MGLAKDERKNILDGKGCLGKAAPDEPIFILRGQDFLAPDLVDEWARKAALHGCHDDKVKEAEQTAALMREWSPRKYPD